MSVVSIKKESKEPVSQAATSTAHVIFADKGKYILDINGINIHATRAVGCLVKPEIGDKVLCFFDPGNTSYVLSVLESVSTESTRLSVENNLVLESCQQDVSLVSKHNVNLLSRQQLNLLSKDLTVSSGKGLLQIEELSLLSKTSSAHLSSGRVYAKQLDIVSETITQRFINSFRFVEKLDQLKAGNIMHTVKNLFSLRTRQAVVLADKDVKIDGERIHMG